MPNTEYKQEGWAPVAPLELKCLDHVRWRKNSRRQFGGNTFYVGLVDYVEETNERTALVVVVTPESRIQMAVGVADSYTFQKYVPWTEGHS